MLRISLLGGLLALVLTMPAGAAFADTNDWGLELRLDKNSTWGSQIRQKDNTSAVYLKINSMGDRASLYTMGWKVKSGKWLSKNCTNGTKVVVKKVGVYVIHQGIKEDGYTHAQITAWRDGGKAKAIWGVWSPDWSGTGSVTHLN